MISPYAASVRPGRCHGRMPKRRLRWAGSRAVQNLSDHSIVQKRAMISRFKWARHWPRPRDREDMRQPVRVWCYAVDHYLAFSLVRRPLLMEKFLEMLKFSQKGGFPKVAFPNPEHAPSCSLQSSRDLSVSRPISLQFGNPELFATFGSPSMSGTAMPEASIHEKGYSLPHPCEVGLAEDRGFAPPSFKSMTSKCDGEKQFSGFVPACSYQRHSLGSFSSSQCVSHGIVSLSPGIS